VKVVDANVLVYAVNERSPHHAAAHEWLDEGIRSGETLGLPWIVTVAFLRLTTSRVILDRPLSPTVALDVVDGWLGQPSVVAVEPTTRHAAVLRGLFAVPGHAANLVNDAHIAALAIEHGADVVTFDRDFARFPGVGVVVPGA
jgi:uncharacterized protein